MFQMKMRQYWHYQISAIGLLSLCTKIHKTEGRHQNRKSRKFGTMSQLGLPPPPSDLWDIFEFGTFLKNVDPPPSYQIGTFLNFRDFWKMLTPPPSYQIGTFWNFRHFWKMLTPPLWPNWDIFEFQTFLIKVILQNTLSNNWNWDIFEK